MPSFSVIIATHKRAALLGRALASLHAQSLPPQQIVVVSDAPDPDTLRSFDAWARAGDVFVQRMGEPGPAASRNLALRLAMGDYVLFLDDDDSFGPDFFGALAAGLAGFAPEQIAYTNFEVLDDAAGVHSAAPAGQAIDLAGVDPAWAYVKNFIPNNCQVFPRALIEGVQFDAALAYEDWDFLLSACDRGRLKHLPVLGPRVHKHVPGTEHRGEKNDSRLVECYLAVYGRHAAPTPQVAEQRRQLFAAIGLDLDRLSGRVA